MTLPEPSDAELVAAAQLEPTAFDAVYRRYLPRVYRYVRARTGSTPEAEDVAASVFVEALTGLSGYTEQGRFAAWLFTIARRQLAASRRREERSVVTGAEAPAVPASPVEERDLVQRGLDALSEDGREALILRFYGGLKVQEVAEVLGKKESATKMLIHRSLRELRGLLGDRP
jgi:RNA polymerase sigma-70 factor (ECF subfamily)